MTSTRMRVFVSAAISTAVAFAALPAHAEAEFGLMSNPTLSQGNGTATVKPQVEAVSSSPKERHARRRGVGGGQAHFASLDKNVPLPQPAEADAVPEAKGAAAAPASIRPAIVRHAAAHGIPAALADAVIKVESRYNPRAYNSGNYGLMQIRLQTARGLGYTGGGAGLLNAETNMRFGMKYLAQAYRMSGGDVCRTVMRYQSGHYASSMSGANRAYCGKVRAYMRDA